MATIRGLDYLNDRVTFSVSRSRCASNRVRVTILPDRHNQRRPVSAVETMELLATLGFRCRAFCGSQLDSGEDVRAALARHGVPFETRHFSIDGHPLEFLLTAWESNPPGSDPKPTSPDAGILTHIALFKNETTAEFAAFSTAFDRFLNIKPPEALKKLEPSRPERAEQRHPNCLARIYREFFSNLFPQPGPPLVPREAA